VLLSRIAQDNEAGAHQVWTQRIGDRTTFGLGVWGLENAKVSGHDLAIYCLISAHLHSLAIDRAAAVRGMNDCMDRVASYAREVDTSLVPIVLSNWRIHLREIFESELAGVPAEAKQAMTRFSEGVSLAPQRPLTFPRPSPWIVDWEAPDAKVRVYTPEGTVHPVAPSEVERFVAARRPGFFARLFGRYSRR
jgi:hypothetical protein